MAVYDDRKKKPLDGPQLIPGTPAAAIAGAVNNVRNNYQATQQAAGKVNLAKNLSFINPADPRSMVARPSNRGLAPAPQPAAVASPAVAQPGASSTQARASAGAPSQVMTLNEADAREKAAASARPATPPLPGQAQGAGAPSSAGRVAAPSASYFTGSNGVRKTINADGSIAGANPNNVAVAQQSFGTQAQPAVARPGPAVASTFGQSVINMDDQQAPAVARPGAFRGPDAVATGQNSREDREARQKLISDLGSQRFEAGLYADNPGRQGRAAMAVLSDIDRQRADLVGGGERLSADAVQGSANRANQFDLANMSEQGDQRRAEMGLNNQFNIASMQDGTERYKADQSAIARPELVQDANGNFVQVGGAVARPVLDAQGKPVRGARQAQDTGAVQPKDALAAVNKELASLVNNPPDATMGGDATAYNARIAELRAQQSAYLGNQPQQARTATNPKTGERMQVNPQTGQWEPVK